MWQIYEEKANELTPGGLFSTPMGTYLAINS